MSVIKGNFLEKNEAKRPVPLGGGQRNNLARPPQKTLTAEQRKKIVEDMRNSMNQYKKQQQTKKPSVGATLKYAFKKAFSKKPKKEQPRQMASKIQVVPHKAKK